jgi:hypothetical protein
VVGAIGGVVLASGVVGAVISFYFQGRSWEYQTGTAKIEKDSAAVLAALEGLDRLIDEKWLSTYELNDAIKSKAQGDKLDAATRRFYSAQQRLGASAQLPGVESQNCRRLAVRH